METITNTYFFLNVFFELSFQMLGQEVDRASMQTEHIPKVMDSKFLETYILVNASHTLGEHRSKMFSLIPVYQERMDQCHREFQVPNMEALNLFCWGGFSLT